MVSYLDKKRHNVFHENPLWHRFLADYRYIKKKVKNVGSFFYGGKYSIIIWYGPPFVSKGQKLLYFKDKLFQAMYHLKDLFVYFLNISEYSWKLTR
jgi:hypothetical protein